MPGEYGPARCLAAAVGSVEGRGVEQVARAVIEVNGKERTWIREWRYPAPSVGFTPVPQT